MISNRVFLIVVNEFYLIIYSLLLINHALPGNGYIQSSWEVNNPAILVIQACFLKLVQF